MRLPVGDPPNVPNRGFQTSAHVGSRFQQAFYLIGPLTIEAHIPNLWARRPSV